MKNGNPVTSLTFARPWRILFFHTVYRIMNAPLYLEVIRHLEATQQADGRRQLSCPPDDNYPGRWGVGEFLMDRTGWLSFP